MDENIQNSPYDQYRTSVYSSLLERICNAHSMPIVTIKPVFRREITDSTLHAPDILKKKILIIIFIDLYKIIQSSLFFIVIIIWFWYENDEMNPPEIFFWLRAWLQ